MASALELRFGLVWREFPAANRGFCQRWFECSVSISEGNKWARNRSRSGEKNGSEAQDMEDEWVQPPTRVVRSFIHSESNPVPLVLQSSTSTRHFGQVMWLAELYIETWVARLMKSRYSNSICNIPLSTHIWRTFWKKCVFWDVYVVLVNLGIGNCPSEGQWDVVQ